MILQVFTRTSISLAASAIFSATAIVAQAATPAAIEANLPPPGLYRVEMDSSMRYAGGASMTVHQPGAGPVTLRGSQPGQTSTTRALPAPTSREVCFGPRSDATSFNPLTLAGKSDCKGGAPTNGAAGTTFTAHCPTMDFTTVVRKLTPTTWEMRTQVTERQTVTTTPDFERDRKALEEELKNAKTSEDRANIKDTLDHWETYKTEMRAAAADTGTAMASGSITRATTAITRLTRLSDACRVAQKVSGR